MKVASAFEASVPSYVSRRCQYPEDRNVAVVHYLIYVYTSLTVVLVLGQLLAAVTTNFCYFFIFVLMATVGIKPQTPEC
jgi:hypothetical protein